MTAAAARSAKAMTRLSGALAVCVGSLVLVGRALDIAALKSVLPGWVSMKPNTALAFVPTGASLWLQRRAPYPYRTSSVPQMPSAPVFSTHCL